MALPAAPTKSPTVDGWTMHVGPMSFLDGEADYDIDWDTLDENKAGVTRDSRGGWLGFTDKYWLTALAPANGAPIEASFKQERRAAPTRPTISAQPFVVAPGQAVTGETRLFAGAKEKRLLDRYEDAGHHQA